MERKPIKRNPHIVLFSKDHHLTLQFCWKIRTGLRLNADAERIKKYVLYFWQSHLLPHFNEEENLLFAPVQDAAVIKALDEHAAIKNQIKIIAGTSPVDAGRLTTLADAVDAHVRYEERELFPHLETVLTQNQLEHIGKTMEQLHPAVCEDAFEDAFWLKQ